jgi:hypothetical protein
VADGLGLLENDWALRYALEEALMQLHQQEEIYWRQRGTLNWSLMGDSPTAYFFAIANGRRRRCTIDSPLINGVRVSDQTQILAHVVDFFSNLLSAKPASGLSLSLMLLLGSLRKITLILCCRSPRRKFGRLLNLLILMRFGP